MNIVSDIASWRKIHATIAGSVGFVPTMGDLHQGHASLAARSCAENDITVASIFVNPTQFNNQDDFLRYKKTLETDCALLDRTGVDYVFAPSADEIYADKFQIQVNETEISTMLEGVFRPGHFTGMMTVVLKLLNIISPTRAYFGEKDFQQLLLVQKMASVLFLPIDIIACPTLRAGDGLALSSRNARLSPEMRAKAALIYKTLISNVTDTEAAEILSRNGFTVEYVETRWNRRLTAAWLDGVRLIDNIDIADIIKEK